MNCQNLNFQSHFNLIRSIEPQKIDTLIEIGPYFFLTKLAPIGWKLQNWSFNFDLIHWKNANPFKSIEFGKQKKIWTVKIWIFNPIFDLIRSIGLQKITDLLIEIEPFLAKLVPIGWKLQNYNFIFELTHWKNTNSFKCMNSSDISIRWVEIGPWNC